MTDQNNLNNDSKTTPGVIIGTRGSELAMWQTVHVGDLLRKKFPDLSVEITKVNTKGDKILDSPLSRIGGKGLFTKELDVALQSKTADIAVHSLKDIPTQIPDDLAIAAIVEREDVRDIFIPNPRHPGLKLNDIPEGGIVATGSLRRRSQLLNMRPDLQITDVRGNLNTRIKKLENSTWSGMILAYAGVVRLGWMDKIGEIIPLSVILPAVGQGAIGIIARKDDERILSVLRPLDHRPTRLATLAERAVLRRLEGGCQVPIGAHAELDGNHITIEALVGDLQGKKIIRDSVSGDAGDHEHLGTELANTLIARGAGEILNDIRKQSGN